ncbi:hypothetical protein SAMN04489722_101353 [Algibacter lectus]|uniref:hypothetical protein n=1 Tax=Algibacter lectus TaxID=221126 RepID=UPI0008E57111|nr:hypothetical protein [Algibacter lectus]SFB95985.1 hypothetical protein SAMN04489722_101353 [Algibacter lectus]
MKNIMTLTLLIFFQCSFCQGIKGVNGQLKHSLKGKKVIDSKLEINQTFFLLGTLSDYMGRFSYVEEKNQFDRYYVFEKPLIRCIDSIAKKYFNTNIIEKDNKLYSEKLSRLMNTFYDDNNLIYSRFKNNNDKVSFILGVYYRNGMHIKDDIYKIQLANSPKHKNCYDFLKELGCESVFFKRLNNIPTQYKIYFKATDAIKAYIQKIETEHSKLFNEKILEYEKSIGLPIEEIIKSLHKNDNLIIELMK